MRDDQAHRSRVGKADHMADGRARQVLQFDHRHINRAKQMAGFIVIMTTGQHHRFGAAGEQLADQTLFLVDAVVGDAQQQWQIGPGQRLCQRAVGRGEIGIVDRGQCDRQKPLRCARKAWAVES